MYKLSLHAQRRIKQRRLCVEWLLAALDGKQERLPDGNLIYCDPVTRCAIVVNPVTMMVVTAMKLRPAKYKRIYIKRTYRRSKQWTATIEVWDGAG